MIGDELPTAIQDMGEYIQGRDLIPQGLANLPEEG
jgi:hypothetical protein